MQEALQTALADAARFLDSEGVPYALIGGLAVALRGHPRATVDVDMVIAADLERSLQLVGSLPDSAFKPLFDDVAQVVEKSFILPLRHRRTSVKVDLAIGLSGFEQGAISRAQPIEFGGVPVSVATTEDLLIMKILAGRPQDDQDVTGLLIAQGAQIDWGYCDKLAAEVGEAVDQDLVGRLSAVRRRLGLGA